MKIGYPCINRSINCTANHTFRLASYSTQKLKETVQQNLICLRKILEFNLKHNLLFFRIGSGLIPFASHPICQLNWQKYFKKDFYQIGKYIQKHQMRISMHPDQFVLINAQDKRIVNKSIKELVYHCQVLDLLGLDQTAKVQIHIGGVYGDKLGSMKRFIQNYKQLDKKTKKRLVVENDDRSYSLKDCLKIHQEIGISIVFDVFHHECLNNQESVLKAVKQAQATWQKKDGLLMVDYSSAKQKGRRCSHAEKIDLKLFKFFLSEIKRIDCDIMLEIKDKEKSALKAVTVLNGLT